MKAKRIISAVVIAASLALVAVAVVNGLSVLYVLGGAVLVIAVLVLVRSFGSTRGRRWALSSISLGVLAALIMTPIQLNTSHNPVLEAAPEDGARWMPDGDGGGYAVTTRFIQHVDSSGDLDWRQTASMATWSTPDGVITVGRDHVKFLNASGDVVWERTAYGLGAPSADIAPVAWKEGITVVSLCDSAFDTVGPAAPACRFVGIDSAGADIYRIEAELASTVYSGNIWSYGNYSGSGANGALPSYFGHAGTQADGISVVDAATGRSVTTVPVGDDITPPAFAGDRVLTGTKSGEVCSLSRVPIDGGTEWTAEVPCMVFVDDKPGALYSNVSLRDGALLDGDVLWWRPAYVDAGDVNAVGIHLESGQVTPQEKVLWRSLTKADAAEAALTTDGLLIEARDSKLTARDPFSDSTPWTAPLQGRFHSADASSGVLTVVTTPARPRLFASEDDLDLTVYALDDGRILGQQRFDPEHATHVLPLDDAALLVLDDDTSIRVGG
jgi:hypothetical protein